MIYAIMIITQLTKETNVIGVDDIKLEIISFALTTSLMRVYFIK